MLIGAKLINIHHIEQGSLPIFTGVGKDISREEQLDKMQEIRNSAPPIDPNELSNFDLLNIFTDNRGTFDEIDSGFFNKEGFF